jgi:hypothetical protein
MVLGPEKPPWSVMHFAMHSGRLTGLMGFGRASVVFRRRVLTRRPTVMLLRVEESMVAVFFSVRFVR